MADTAKEKHQEAFFKNRFKCISVTFQIPGTDRHQLPKKSGGNLSTAAAKSADSKNSAGRQVNYIQMYHLKMHDSF